MPLLTIWNPQHYPFQLILSLHLFVSSFPLLSVCVEVEVKALCSQGLFFAGEMKPLFISDPLSMRDASVQQPTYCAEIMHTTALDFN